MSRANGGVITLRLNRHVNPEQARFEASAIVRQAWPSLPEGTSYPAVQLSGVSKEAAMPFMRYTINAPHSPIAIRDYVEAAIKPRLSDIKGIDAIEVSGATRMIWKLEYDFESLKRHELTVAAIRAAVQSHLGREFMGMAQVDATSDEWIRLVLVHDSPGTDFNPASIPVQAADGRIFRLAQLVTCLYTEEEATSYFRINGLNSIYLSFTARDEANRLRLCAEVEKRLAALTPALPDDYEVHLVYNEGDYLNSELNKIYSRTGLTVLLLLVFVLLVYRNLKYSLLIVISLAINLGIAFIFYFLLGTELQMFSLAGLTISLTLIIDNVIVMSDQIIRLHNRKAFIAIFAATATTMGALVIIFFMDENMRLNLQDFAAVIIINLTASLLVAILLVPALIDILGLVSYPHNGGSRKRRRIRWKRQLVRFNRFYERLICAFCRRKFIVIAAVVLLFGLPVFMLPDRMEHRSVTRGYYSVNPDTTFLGKLYNSTIGTEAYREKIKPVVNAVFGGTLRLFAKKVKNGSYSSSERSETSLYITASMPNGATRDQLDALVRRMESYIRQFHEVRQFETNVYSGQRASIRVLFIKEEQHSGFPFRLKGEVIGKALELGGGNWAVYGFGDGFSNEMHEQAGGIRIKLLATTMTSSTHGQKSCAIHCCNTAASKT
jgi:multidrug efflux pump subunit AcrB